MQKSRAGGEGDPEPGRPGRRGRPPSTTHDHLQAVALELIARQGYDDTTVDDIAAAAGIARRTFFRYYPSKADVVWGDFRTPSMVGQKPL